ncbi:MAG: filamentous hemagglutinin N-terminal domain-containing protein, partial [Rhodocyclaceae bacterium]
MNRIYRSIWNDRTGTFVAASEKTHARGKRSSTVAAVVAGALIAPLLIPAEVVAQTAVARGNTLVFSAPNGVQVVDIATTNGAGVSHNQYTHYNVARTGQILNNNSPITRTGPMQSQLGGQIVPNQNLTNEARLIINEVVAANRSTLAGYTEVVGRKADVVVANPWGITCTGCGFINTDRVTLTTGVPTFGGDGSLSGFLVNQGDILVNGAGLDGRNQNVLDLLARSIKIDGQINARDVQVAAGSFSYNHDTRAATPLTATGAIPLFAVDSTALGGMYANRIRLIATEAGVGVRMLGEAAASGDDFTLSAAGKLEIHSKIGAERDISLSYNGPGSAGAAALDISGSAAELAAKRDIAMAVQNAAGATLSDGKITAGQDLVLSAGSLSDTSRSAATRFAGRDNLVNTSGAVGIDGPTWGAGGKLAMNMASLTIGNNGATLYSGGDSGAGNRDLELVASAGGLTLNNASLLAGNDLTLGGSGTDDITVGASGSVKAAGSIAASASNQIDNSGSLLARNQVQLQATDAQATLINRGTLQASAGMVLGSTGHVLDASNQSTGVILADNLNIAAAALTNAGAMQATTGSTVSGTTFTNAGVSAQFLLSTVAGSDGSLNFSGAVDNQGTLQSAGALTLASGAAISNSGKLFALHASNGGRDEALTVTAQRIDNSGVVDGGGALNLTATNTTGNSFNNTGNIQG